MVLAAAAVWPSSWPVRLTAAVAVSLYHLLESCGTNRHGEYPLLYNAVGMLLPADCAHAFALGVAILCHPQCDRALSRRIFAFL